MGQIQNAITGAVSSIVGAQVAGELKTQREITGLTKDIGTVTEQIEGFKEKEKKFDADVKKRNDMFKSLSPEQQEKRRADYQNWFEESDRALNQEYESIKGWKTRVQARLDALKSRKASSLDLEVAVKNANERIDALEYNGPKTKVGTERNKKLKETKLNGGNQ